MYNIASIVTPNYFDRALAMFESINEYVHAKLHLLVVAGDLQKLEYPVIENLKIYDIKDISVGSEGRINRLIFNKYRVAETNLYPEIIAPLDYLRWALKPGFVGHLLKENESIIFCDNDLYFYNNPKDILQICLENDMTISPHWRTIDRSHNDEMKYNFMHGLYNGGFFTATKAAMNILDWWAENCCIECSATSPYTYVDQKYLDLLPLYFADQVGILRHKGCNVAAWNCSYLERTRDKKNRVLVAGDPVIFIHYSPITIRYIELGIDRMLIDHLMTYNDKLMEIRIDLLRQGKENLVSGSINNTYLI